MPAKDMMKAVLRRPADALLASSTRLRYELKRQFLSPSQSAQFFAVEEGQDVVIHPAPPPAEPTAGSLPVPDKEHWEGYAETVEDYLEGGATDARRKLEQLGEVGFKLTTGMRVLDFGCAGGRVVRHLEPYARDNEIWGCDLQAKSILWCQDNLSPPFHFVTTTTFPHLPFEDNYFDLIYADSVFTHITGLAEMWLLELRRTIKPGGLLYATVHDKHAMEMLASGKYDDSKGGRYLLKLYREFIQPRLSGGDYAMATLMFNRDARATQVWHDINWLKRHWSPFMQIEKTVEEAYGYQTAVIMRKRAS